MFGKFDGGGIPTLLTYAEAVAHEANVEPIRGRAVETKPLGQRNKSYVTIRKEGDNIIVAKYGTDMLTYRPDNTIRVHGGRRNIGLSHTDHMLLGCVLRLGGVRFLTCDSKSWVRCRTKDGNAPVHHKDIPMPADGFTLTPMDGKLVWVNPTYPERLKVDRTAMNAVRKLPEVERFRNYMLGAIKLCPQEPENTNHWRAIDYYKFTEDGTVFSHDMYVQVFGRKILVNLLGVETPQGLKSPTELNRLNRVQVEELYSLITSDEPGDNLKALLWLMYTYEKNVAVAKKNLDRVLHTIYSDKVFKKECVTEGNIYRDGYGYAFI